MCKKRKEKKEFDWMDCAIADLAGIRLEDVATYEIPDKNLVGDTETDQEEIQVQLVQARAKMWREKVIKLTLQLEKELEEWAVQFIDT